MVQIRSMISSFIGFVCILGYQVDMCSCLYSHEDFICVMLRLIFNELLDKDHDFT